MLPPYVFVGYRRYLRNVKDRSYIDYHVLGVYHHYRRKTRACLLASVIGAVMIAFARQSEDGPVVLLLVLGVLCLLGSLAYGLFCNSLVRAVRRGYPELVSGKEPM